MPFAIRNNQYWPRQYDDAIPQARKTLEMDPNSTIARLLLGVSFLKKGDMAGAIAELQKTKKQDPGAWYQEFLGSSCVKSFRASTLAPKP